MLFQVPNNLLFGIHPFYTPGKRLDLF